MGVKQLGGGDGERSIVRRRSSPPRPLISVHARRRPPCFIMHACLMAASGAASGWPLVTVYLLLHTLTRIEGLT